MEKKKVIDLEIVDEMLESGVSKISLVDQPAIDVNWFAFKEEKFIEPNAGESEEEFLGRCVPAMLDEGKPQDQAVAMCYSMYENMSYDTSSLPVYVDEIPKKKVKMVSYTDYPKAASENAQRALDWAEENGWGDCGTPIGKMRANQLAKNEPITEDTIARMAAFERHRQNSTTPYGEGCGKLMWDAWGGTEGVEWAQRKLGQIREEMAAVDLEVFGYPTRHFDMCPGAVATFQHLMEMPLEDDTVGMVRSAALLADRIFEIEKNVIAAGVSSEANLLEAALLAKDFYDIISEVNEDTGMVHEVGYMDGHLLKIAELMPDEEMFASIEDLKVDDAVSWTTGGQNPRGRIRKIIRDGSEKVPGADFEISGTPENPGYLIEVYEENDGQWSPSGRMVGRKADSLLKNVQLSKQEPNWNSILEKAKHLGFSAEDPEAEGLQFIKSSSDPLQNMKFAAGYTVYKYEGDTTGDSRDFCVEMAGMNKFYTYSDIAAMGSEAVNPGFGLGGADTYSIWKWKGGPNCKHFWQKYYVTASGQYQNKGKAPGTAGEAPAKMPNNGYAMSKMIFASEDQQIIIGPAMIPDIEIIRKDEDTGEPYYVKFSKDVIQRIAEKFMKELRNRDTNIQHDANTDAQTYVMESWIVESENDKANDVYGFNVPVGTWMTKMRVTDPKVWQMVKSGKLKGLSIEGNFVDAEQLQNYEQEGIYKRIIRILNEE